jgi:hypothetical protein
VVIRAWRKPLVLIGAIATALVVGLSFGEVLTVDGHLVHFFGVHSHLPYKFLTHVKYIQNIEPVRYMYIAWIGIALLGAYGLDLMLRWRKGGSGRDGLLRTAAVTAVCATVVLTLVPGETYNMPNTVVPSWITSAQAHREIPNGSVVLFYPYPTLLSNHALLDQAMGNFYFKIIGGEGLIGGKGGVNVGVTPLAPLALPSAFIRIWQQNPTLPIIGDPITLPPLPPNDTTTVAAFRYFVQLHHVRALIVETQLDAHWAQLMPYLRSAFGSPVSHDHGEIYVWLFAHKAFS